MLNFYSLTVQDILGLSRKFPNILRKNFPVLPWSYSACCLQSTPLYSVCTAASVSSMFWNIPGKLFQEWCANALANLSWLPQQTQNGGLSALIWALETERSQLVRDLESTKSVEGQSSRVWRRSHGQGTMNVRARCHVGASIDSPATHQVFFPDCLTKTLHIFQIILLIECPALR